MKQNFLLKNWLELASDYYATSKDLIFHKITYKQPPNSGAHLLHLSIELYLKAFLMHHDIAFPFNQKGHDLCFLFSKCLKIDPNSENISTNPLNYKQSYWINSINEYGKHGGIRYMSSKRPEWSIYILIHEQFDDLVEHINVKCDKNKIITKFI